MPPQPPFASPQPHYQAQVPPQAQPMPQQPPSYAPIPPHQQVPPPAAYPPAPLAQLTGGMKFGWFAVGALMGIPGILIAWLVNVDKMPQVKSDAVKFSVIGFAVWVALGVVLSLLVGGLFAAALTGIVGTAGYYGTW